MILLFDIGNSNMFIGVANHTGIIESHRMTTDANKTADEIYAGLKNFFDVSSIKAIAISSVVPRVTEQLKEMAISRFKVDPLIVGPGIKTGLNIKTDNPREVGADLICDAVGIEPSIEPTLIVDLGTATKFIYVKNKTILGVVIMAGVQISVRSLVGNTALLLDIDIEAPKRVLGTNTVTSMQSGVTYGTAAMIEGMVEKIALETKEKANLIITGGYAEIISPLCKLEHQVNSNLVLEGLYSIYLRNEVKKVTL